MTKSGMSNSICAALSSVGYKQVSSGSEHKLYNKEFIDALAEGIVKHIQAEAKAIDTDSEHGGNWDIK